VVASHQVRKVSLQCFDFRAEYEVLVLQNPDHGGDNFRAETCELGFEVKKRERLRTSHRRSLDRCDA
jgi:hypothetical protein